MGSSRVLVLSNAIPKLLENDLAATAHSVEVERPACWDSADGYLAMGWLLVFEGEIVRMTSEVLVDPQRIPSRCRRTSASLTVAAVQVLAV